jgi:hypothetical protein
MRAILIDPIAHTVTVVQHNNDYKQIYQYLSDKEHGLEVSDFNAVTIDRRNMFFVDGEGLLKDPRYFFVWRGGSQPYAGRGLVLGYDQQGETVSTTWTVSKVADQVSFLELSVLGFETTTGKMDHPLGGPNTGFIRSVPIFGAPVNNDDDSGEKQNEH